jgi:hypothetical protein
LTKKSDHAVKKSRLKHRNLRNILEDIFDFAGLDAVGGTQCTFQFLF